MTLLILGSSFYKCGGMIKPIFALPPILNINLPILSFKIDASHGNTYAPYTPLPLHLNWLTLTFVTPPQKKIEHDHHIPLFHNFSHGTTLCTGDYITQK